MRILELCLSPSYGGLELHVRDFCLWLSKRPDTKLFLCLQTNSSINKDLNHLNLPTITFDKMAGKFPLGMARRLASFIDQHQIDVIHMHWKDDLPLAALAKRFCKRKIGLVHSRHMLLPMKKHDLYHKYIYKPVDKYITITKDLKKHAEMYLPIDKDKIEAIYYGIEPPVQLDHDKIQALKGKFNLDNKFTVGLIGRICQEKKQHMLIEAVQILKEKDIHINALIVGGIMKDEYVDGLKKYVAEHELESYVHFSDFYDRPTDLMQCVDVVVLLTGVETFGLVLIEGMYCGIPVIGSNLGGVPEIIDHGVTGLMFESDNLTSLVEELTRLYNDRALRIRLGQEGKRKAEKMYVLDQQYGKVLNALRESINS
jgi:glycosyltransferase involved in cell wall biosynthesis